MYKKINFGSLKWISKPSCVESAKMDIVLVGPIKRFAFNFPHRHAHRKRLVIDLSNTPRNRLVCLLLVPIARRFKDTWSLNEAEWLRL